MQFGTSEIAKIEKSLQTVRASLENEIKYEKENYEKIKEIDEFLEQSGFKVISSPDQHIIQIIKGKLFKFHIIEVGKQKVKITFESQSPEAAEDEETEVPEQYSEYQEMMDQNFQEFIIQVYSGKESEKGIIAEFAAQGEELSLVYVAISKNMKVNLLN